MFIDVQELWERREPLLLDHTFRPEELELKDPLYALRQPVRFSGSAVALSGQDVRIQGALSTRLDLVCSRCLMEFQKTIYKAIDLTYMPNESRGPDEEIALSYGDLDVGLFTQSRIDLNSVMIEQIVLEIPMKPVCSTACRGLCDQCGADLNSGACNCVKTSDPRWAGLAPLRDRLNK